MFCKKCGKEIPDESLCCPFCMTKFSDEGEKKKPNKKLIIIIAAVVAVIAIVVAAVIAVPKLKGDDSIMINGEVQGQGSEKDGKDKEKETKPAKPKSVEEDDSIGFVSVKINKNDDHLTDEQKLIIKYFDVANYFDYTQYNALQRYPQVYKDAQISFECVVHKIMESTGEEFTALVEYGAYKIGGQIDIQTTGDYAVIKGKHSTTRIIEGDSLIVYGEYEDTATYDVDGTSFTVPTIFVNHYRFRHDFYEADPMFTFEEIRTIAKQLFGEDVKVRRVQDSDYTAEELEGLEGIGYEYIVEPDNQSNANFSKYSLHADLPGQIYDWNTRSGSIDRKITFSADFNYLYLQTFDRSIETYTIECFDKDLNKIWKREFDKTAASAELDYTPDHIYLAVNGYLYILDAKTGENAIEPKYVGKKCIIRKLTDGILLLGMEHSDAVMKTDLVGNIKWTVSVAEDWRYDEGYLIWAKDNGDPKVQINNGNYVIKYSTLPSSIDYSIKEISAVISPDGQLIFEGEAF